jgi:hypothetical protein
MLPRQKTGLKTVENAYFMNGYENKKSLNLGTLNPKP